MKKIVIIIFLSAVSYFAATSFEDSKKEGKKNSQLLNDQTKKDITPTTKLSADLTTFNNKIKPVLSKQCVDCHGEKKEKGNFRIDLLDPNLLLGKDVSRWKEVYEVISNYEMPPDDEKDYHLKDKDRTLLVDWLSEELNKASILKQDLGAKSSIRRLTKYEYNYLLQDLLSLPYNFVGDLMDDPVSKEGFKNNSSLLQMSESSFDNFRSAANKALKQALNLGKKPKVISYSIPMSKAFDKAKTAGSKGRNKGGNTYILNKKDNEKILYGYKYNGKRWMHTPSKKPLLDNPKKGDFVAVLPANKSLILDVGNFLPKKGLMQVRVRVGKKSNKSVNRLRLLLGYQPSNNSRSTQIISEDFEVEETYDNAEFIVFNVHLNQIERNPYLTSGKLGRHPNSAEVLIIQNLSSSNDNIQIDYVDIKAPIYKSWPSKSHTNIFIKSNNKNDEEKYSREILNNFMKLTWRRNVSKEEVDKYVSLFKQYRNQFDSFEEAIVEVLTTVLVSFNTLYIVEKGNNDGKRQEITNIELASRLSFFLWSSIPDETLLNLAINNKLKNPVTLQKQVDRMLASPKANRFTKHFVNQWLGLDAFNNLSFEKKLFGNLSDGKSVAEWALKIDEITNLKNAMNQEPLELFKYVLNKDKSIIDFIHAEYMIINEDLANHYGISNIKGNSFRKINLTKHDRGGIFSTAVVLAMNSNGEDSNIVKRGVWLLENILHDPPPPPPPAVPEVDLTDPEILKMTLAERIQNHRNDPACFSCHTRIDPWGLAFENFDAIGRYRTTIKDKKVENSSELYNKRVLTGLSGVKKYLLEDRQDQFVKAFIHKLLTYGLGRNITFGDDVEIKKIAVKCRKDDDKLKRLIKHIVLSKIFQSK